MVDPGPRPDVVRVSLSPASLVLVLVAVAGAVVLRNLFVDAATVVGWAVAASVLAILVHPAVAFLDRHLPHVLAILIVLISGAALIGGVAYRVFDDLSDEIRHLQDVAPQAARDIEASNEVARDFHLAERVETWTDELPGRLRGGAVNTVATSVSAYLVTIVLTVFLLIWGPRIAAGAFGLIDDDERRHRWEHLTTEAVGRGQRYLLLTIAQGVVVGLVVYALAEVVDLPAPAALALFAGFLGTINSFGIALGFAPLVLLSGGLEAGWTTTGLVMAGVGLQLLEVGIVHPRIERASLGFGPALTIVFGLLGFDIYGLGGAVFAIALLVFVMAAVDAAAPAEPVSAEPVPA